MKYKVNFVKVEKALQKIPKHIYVNLIVWARSVELSGMQVVRRIPGYHDEPLKGRLAGKRSVRLSRSYRAIYSEEQTGEITIIKIEGVNKHEY